METLLKQKLAQVGRRFRNGRFAMWLILFWGILLAIASIASSQGYRATNPMLFSAILAILTAFLGLIAFFLSRLAYRNEVWIASKIEERYQTLEQRLMTIIEKPADNSNTAALFFRRELLKETLNHADTHDWREAMPSAWFNQLWFAQTILLCLSLLVSSHLILPLASENTSQNLVGNSLPTNSLSVEPGNSDIEKGSNVVFTARFQGLVPAEASLEYSTDENSDLLRLPLRRNLEDPVFGGVLLGIEKPINYRVVYSDGMSENFRLNVFEYPRVIRSDAKVTPPAYAASPERLIEDTRRVTVAEGSQLTWILHLNKPVTSAGLVDKQGNQQPLTAAADSATVYSITLSPTESTTWSVQLLDAEGRKNKLPEDLIVKVLPNKPPTIKIAKASDRRVSPLEEMDIGAKLNDDFGISKVGIAYSINGDEPTNVVLMEPENTLKKMDASHLLPLEQLKAKPDQLISYYVWAEDKDSAGNPRRVESDLFFAEVRPFEEIYREGESPSESQQSQQQQQQGGGAEQQAEEAAELQRQIIVAIWNIIRRETGEERTENFQPDLQVIAESQAEVIEKLADLQQNAGAPDAAEIVAQIQTHMKNVIRYLTEAREKSTIPPVQNARAAAQSAYAGLLQLRAREHEIVRSRQQQQSQSQSRSQQNRQQQLNELELKNDPNRYESQQTPPQPEEEQQAQEVRQAINRLKELAQRQEDLNEELQKLQAELEAAKTEEEKKNLEEQLDRLRDAQEELLRDADELNERMNEANENEAMQQTREQMEQARENVRQAAESLANNDPNQALAAGTRAEREFEEMRDELRQQSANQFSEQMQDMLQQAKQLNEKQKQLSEQATAEPKPEDNSGLRSESSDSKLPQDLREQSQKLTELLDQMQQTVTEAETSEPLLADKLYDSFRETKQQNIEENLKQLSQLAEQGVEVGRVPETQRFMEQATQGIDRLQQQIESAAEAVLGSEAESLRRALRELGEAAEDVNQELRNATGGEAQESQREISESSNAETQSAQTARPSDTANDGRSGEMREPPDTAAQPQTGEGQATQPQPNQAQPNQAQPNQAQPNSASQPGSESQPASESEPNSDSRGNGATGEPRDVQPTNNRALGQNTPTRQNAPVGNGRASRNETNSFLDQLGGADTAAPISGDDFLEFSDRLRDVEEMLTDPDLQSRVAQIREAARDIRREARKHSADPQWSLVERLVANPLRDLRQKLQEELLRKTAEKNSLVPIDRDPVPSEFEKAQQKYYENLGSGKR